MHALLLSAPNPAAGHHWPMHPPQPPRHTQASLGQSLIGSLLLSPGSWYTQGFVCALQESVSLVLCKCWHFYRGVNDDLLQEDLCHTQACRSQSSCPCRSPLLTHTTAGDIKHSSVSVSVEFLGPGVHKVGLSPLSISGRYGVSQPPLQHLQSCWSFSALGHGSLLTAAPGLHRHCSRAFHFPQSGSPIRKLP